ncbi:hypothetical protein [Rathayibacter soli]|uniref:hypothetical protein n=1 Tax=Rathayibacter soli TaxID=3144168 RepID=UPI0027E4597F|nr:hypothetical protein [Glaciibacter superstes]
MNERVSRHRPHRTVIVLVIAGLVTAALIGVGAYGLVHNPGTPTPADTSANTVPTAMAAGPDSPVPTAVPTVAPIVNAEQFARHLAMTLFAWNTTSELEPADYIQASVEVGDPSGQETPGLAADLTSYYPTEQTWAQLRQYQTRQWLTIDTAVVPSVWPQALQQGRGTLLPGTTAYTITGTRHRAGVWDGKPVSTSGQVSFTVFETCQPTYSTCRLLRLSQLGKPLR